MYTIREKSNNVNINNEVSAILEKNKELIDACIKNNEKTLCIVKVYRKMKHSEVFPKSLETDVIPKSSEGLYLKKVKLINSNPWKFNTLFSVRREIDSLSSVNHPNIVKFHGVLSVDGLIEGVYLDSYDCTLSYIIKNKIEFDRLKFFKFLVDAVDYLKSIGFVHGDIHDENIMVKLSNPSFPYLVDFDCCERAGTEIISTTKTFGEPRCNIVTYGCDSSALIEIFKSLF